MKKILITLALLPLTLNLTGCVGALIAGAAATGAASGFYLSNNYEIKPKQSQSSNSNYNNNKATNSPYDAKATDNYTSF